jgi:hypothetical protein
MSDSEKWGWWTIGAVALTIAAYVAFRRIFGARPRHIVGFRAVGAHRDSRPSSRRHFKGRRFDEREREIARKAVRAGVSARSGWRSLASFSRSGLPRDGTPP